LDARTKCLVAQSAKFCRCYDRNPADRALRFGLVMRDKLKGYNQPIFLISQVRFSLTSLALHQA